MVCGVYGVYGFFVSLSVSVIVLLQADGGGRDEQRRVHDHGSRSCELMVGHHYLIGLFELVFEELLVLLVKRFELGGRRRGLMLRTLEA